MINAVLTFLGMAVLGIFAWAFSLSNRVAVMETEQAALKKSAEADRSSLKELFEAKFQELTRRLDSIDHKLG